MHFRVKLCQAARSRMFLQHSKSAEGSFNQLKNYQGFYDLIKQLSVYL